MSERRNNRRKGKTMTNHTEQNLTERIQAIRAKWGRRLLILGHYYQRPEILAVADARGDSFQLSATAAQNNDCEVIVFCGVHFMAETADLLANAPKKRDARSGRRVRVLLPDAEAGCPMADMATLSEVERAWSELGEWVETADIAPITYVNSSAAIKAFCGARGGIACTSSNAGAVLRSALATRSRLFFMPDQHLGRNTALAMGIPPEEILLWHGRGASPAKFGGNSPEAVRSARVFLWDGFCPVHQLFSVEQIARIRADDPKTNIVVHPECEQAVVAAADTAGSTKKILDVVTESPAESHWAIGTERRMVEALEAAFPDKTILPLAPEKPECLTMARITLENLCRTLEALDAGQTVPTIEVPEPLANDARLALERMLACR